MIKRFGRSRKSEEPTANKHTAEGETPDSGETVEPAEPLNAAGEAVVEAKLGEREEEESVLEHANSRSVEMAVDMAADMAEADAALSAMQAEHATQVETLRAEARENYDKYLRAVAELENVKKRAMKERSELLKYGGESLARDLLEVLDSLEMSVSRDYPGANEELLKGIKLVLDLFASVFERHMIRGETSVGQPFDPEKHQAMTSVPTTEHAHNSIMQEFRKAYFFKDRLLRPAQVVVATNPPSGAVGKSASESIGQSGVEQVEQDAGQEKVDSEAIN